MPFMQKTGKIGCNGWKSENFSKKKKKKKKVFCENEFQWKMTKKQRWLVACKGYPSVRGQVSRATGQHWRLFIDNGDVEAAVGSIPWGIRSCYDYGVRTNRQWVAGRHGGTCSSKRNIYTLACTRIWNSQLKNTCWQIACSRYCSSRVVCEDRQEPGDYAGGKTRLC